MFKDKDVILVGNSVEIMEYNLKEYIDSFDIVVHFGKAIGRNERQTMSLGSKTDVWITGLFRAPMWKSIKGKYGNTKIMLNKCRRFIDQPLTPKQIKAIPNFEYIDMFSDKELIDIYDEFGFGEDFEGSKGEWVTGGLKRPSVGFLGILYFIRKVKIYKSLHIIGFDFFNKSTNKIRPGCKISTPHSWHLPLYTVPEGSHNTDIEQKYVSKLDGENKLKWHILSNLDLETIDYGDWLNKNIDYTKKNTLKNFDES